MFNLFKKKTKGHMMVSPVDGKSVSLSKVNDPTFSGELLGKGIAILPSNGNIYAPDDGELVSVFNTGHAFMMQTDFGAEVLVHIGIDTVKMEGKGFIVHMESGSRVKKGDLIISVDLDEIKKAGYDDIVSLIICNTPDFSSVEGMEKDLVAGDDVLSLGQHK